MGRGRSLALPVICSGVSMTAATQYFRFAVIREIRVKDWGVCRVCSVPALQALVVPGPRFLRRCPRLIWGGPLALKPEQSGALVFFALFRGQSTGPTARAERRALPYPQPLRSLRPPVQPPRRSGCALCAFSQQKFFRAEIGMDQWFAALALAASKIVSFSLSLFTPKRRVYRMKTTINPKPAYENESESKS